MGKVVPAALDRFISSLLLCRSSRLRSTDDRSRSVTAHLSSIEIYARDMQVSSGSCQCIAHPWIGSSRILAEHGGAPPFRGLENRFLSEECRDLWRRQGLVQVEGNPASRRYALHSLACRQQ